MAAIITHNFRQANAFQFYESFGETAATNYYLFVGRPQAFATGTGGGTDAAPPTPKDNVGRNLSYYRDMMSAARISSSDVSYAIPRNDWTTGTTYDYYRHDYGETVNAATVQTVASGTDLFASGTNFVVKSADNNVYKCMWNDGSTASTVEPTGTATTELTTGDGYVWKYMYSLSSTQAANFLTSDFMAVATDSTVAAAAVDGGVNRYHIANGGAGYTNNTYTAQALKGDGTSATFTVVVSGGAVSTVTAVNAGTGYTFADCKIDSISGIGSPSTSAVVTPIIGPKGGHGKNAVKELGGFYVMTNTSIAGTAGSGDFVVGNDFRRVGVVRDPYNYGTTTISTASTLSALKTMTFAASPTPGTFVVDEVITGGTSGAKGEVVDWDATNRILKYIQTQWTGVTAAGVLTAFAGSEVVTGATSSATGTTSAIGNPEIDYYSGHMIYAENRAPIVRAADQTENIKLIIEF